MLTLWPRRPDTAHPSLPGLSNSRRLHAVSLHSSYAHEQSGQTRDSNLCPCSTLLLNAASQMKPIFSAHVSSAIWITPRSEFRRESFAR